MLTSYNLVLALAAVPAAYAARRRPVIAFVARDARVRRCLPRVRARAVLRRARRRALRSGARRRAPRLRRARPADGGRRVGRARRADVGPGGRDRRRARPRRRRDPHRDARLGVDLPRPGAARARDAPRVLASACPAAGRAGGTTEPRGEPRAPPRLRRPDGGAVPPRAAPRRRLAHSRRRCRDRRDRHAGRRDRHVRGRISLRRPRHALGLRLHPHRGWPHRARRAARIRLVVDDRTRRSSSGSASGSRCPR